MFSCVHHTAHITDRGGLHKIVALTPISRVRWERLRDDISQATIYIEAPGPSCKRELELAEAGRMEIVIFRGGARVWEGPITHVTYRGDSVEITARDVMHYVNRTALHNEYDNSYPNIVSVVERVERIMRAELARKEALDPPVNILRHAEFRRADDPINESRTSSRTLPWEMSVFDHIDSLAARGGLDYTVVGRKIIFFDVHQPLGITPMVTAADFLGDPIITQYGMELATLVAMTDGRGNAGMAGGIDPYYGEWEIVHQAYDEDTAREGDEPPSVAELASQAQRSYKSGKIPPLVVRIPDNTSLNPNGVLTMADLVPGVFIPLSANLPGRSLSQMQKLDSMSVEESEKGEFINVTLSVAYAEDKEEEE